MEIVERRLNVLELQQGIACKMLRLTHKKTSSETKNENTIGISSESRFVLIEGILLDFGRQSGPVPEQPVGDDCC